MRVIADANVLISAALTRSPQAPSALTLDAALTGRIELITSPHLLQEIAMVLARPRLRKYLSTHEAQRFITDLAAQTNLIADPPGPHPALCRDPHDDYLFALAATSSTELLVTGDLDLLSIDPDQGGAAETSEARGSRTSRRQSTRVEEAFRGTTARALLAARGMATHDPPCGSGERPLRVA